MAKVYKNLLANFSNEDEFKEVAVKTLTEIYGRSEPFDVFDFAFDKEGYGYAFAYRDGEEIPEEGSLGAHLSVDQAKAQGEALADAAKDDTLLDGEDKETITIKATDAAKKYAEEKGVDLSGLVGTGSGGNITKGDVELAIKAAEANPKPAPEQENANGQGDAGTDA